MDSAVIQNRFLIGYGAQLWDDISDGRFAHQPVDGANHPAWILGHLAYAADGAIAMLGGDKVLPAAWTPLFGRGSEPTGERAAYPDKEELVSAIVERYETARQLASHASAESLVEPNPNEMLRAALPTKGDLILFLLTSHLAIHLGQLSAWRRMLGMPPLF